MKKRILAATMLLALACEKEALIDPVPAIELRSIGPKMVKELQDSVRIRIFYQDGDGDLGGGHPDSNNVFVIDNRSGLKNGFRLQNLVPDGSAVPIQGELDILLNSLFISDSNASQAVNFSIYLIDQAGHKSNTLITENLNIYRE